MENTVENSQIEEFIANLKGRKAYEEKKAIKLGFSNFEDYVADKISKKSRNLQVFVRLLSSECGVKIKLKQSRLLLVVAVDIDQLSLGSNPIGTLN